MSADEILKLIESADPTDYTKLDEIDARAEAFFKNQPYKSHFKDEYGELVVSFNGKFPNSCCGKYTRSRDALKAIRPEGWCITVVYNCDLPAAIARMYKEETFGFPVVTPQRPTEELAELHAIIQAIQYEREKA